MIADVIAALPNAYRASEVRRNPRLLETGPLYVVRYGGSVPDSTSGRSMVVSETVRLVVTVVRREWQTEAVEESRRAVIQALADLRSSEQGEGALEYEGSGEPVDFSTHTEFDVEFSYRARITL